MVECMWETGLFEDTEKVVCSEYVQAPVWRFKNKS
jgi:hypothetical protein